MNRGIREFHEIEQWQIIYMHNAGLVVVIVSLNTSEELLNAELAAMPVIFKNPNDLIKCQYYPCSDKKKLSTKEIKELSKIHSLSAVPGFKSKQFTCRAHVLYYYAIASWHWGIADAKKVYKAWEICPVLSL